MIRVWRIAWLTLSVASIAIAVSVFLSGTLRSAYLLVMERKIASVWPPRYALVGDSLTANCNWRWELGTASVVNLGVGGSDIRDVSHQIAQALILKPSVLAIEGGINDVLLEGASATRIEEDFTDLLRAVPSAQKAVVTLVPFVSSRSSSGKIADANSRMKTLAEARGFPIIDLNLVLARGGVRIPKMTTDGIHFTRDACRIWAEELRAKSHD
jgi:lysophospholipase L1-like esterase